MQAYQDIHQLLGSRTMPSTPQTVPQEVQPITQPTGVPPVTEGKC